MYRYAAHTWPCAEIVYPGVAVSAAGDNYCFSDGQFFIANSDSGLWHPLSIMDGSFLIGAGTTPSTPGGEASISGTNYEFSTSSRFRLAGDGGNFHEFWSEGDLNAETLLQDDGSASAPGSVVDSGTLFKFEASLFYVRNTAQPVWLALYIIGAANEEEIKLG